MRRFLTLGSCLLLLSLFPLTALAQSADIEAGFRLGRYAMGAATLALELSTLRDLIEQAAPGEVTDEAYQAGELTDDELDMASHVLAYAIWRIQFFIDPVLEGVLDDDTFTHPGMAEYREQTVDSLTRLKAARDAFMAEGTDFTRLEAFYQDLKAGQYDTALMELAEQAQAQAGLAEDE